MTRADAMGLLLAGIARLITGAQGHWKGCAPKAEQRIYFANHQSHLDWVLIWAALPRELRASTRPIAARDYWTANRFKHWLTREVFNAVYVSRARSADQDPLEPLLAALKNGDSLVIFPEGTRSSKGVPQAFKSGLFHLAEAFPQVQTHPRLDRQRAARDAQGRSGPGAHPLHRHLWRAAAVESGCGCGGGRNQGRVSGACPRGGDGLAAWGGSVVSAAQHAAAQSAQAHP